MCFLMPSYIPQLTTPLHACTQTHLYKHRRKHKRAVVVAVVLPLAHAYHPRAAIAAKTTTAATTTAATATATTIATIARLCLHLRL